MLCREERGVIVSLTDSVLVCDTSPGLPAPGSAPCCAKKCLFEPGLEQQHRRVCVLKVQAGITELNRRALKLNPGGVPLTSPARADLTRSMPSRASSSQTSSRPHTASLPMHTPCSLAPISAPHSHEGRLRTTAWVCGTCSISM